MATWSDYLGNAYGSFSSDNGVTWSSPIVFATNVMVSPYQTDASVAGATSGFVAAWIGNDSNAYGSFYNNDTETWSTPVQITTDGSVVADGVYEENGYSFVSVNAQGNNCLFAWLGNDGNTYSSFSSITICPVSTIITVSHVVKSGSSNVINATISGGTPPYTIVWADGLIQTSASTSISRIVMSYVTRQFQIVSVTDADECISDPSNVITLTVIPCY
jgi:hypothetical protein